MPKKDQGYDNKPKVEVTDSVKTHVHDTFIIVEKNGICFIAIGDKITSKKQFNTVEEAKAYIDSKPWELIINVACAAYEIVLKQINNNK